MNDPFASRLFEKAQERAYLGVVEPQDLAELVCFLASPSALRLTGQTISVTGGISAAQVDVDAYLKINRNPGSLNTYINRQLIVKNIKRVIFRVIDRKL